jgi:NOL1/NOP2/sun family putative RNA methylase
MPANSPVPIPPLFLERMKTYLGEEFPAFTESLNADPKSGLRVNTLKVTTEEFRQIFPAELGETVPWCPSAFTLPPSNFRLGTHPYHLAGLYYLQDPSAMSPAELLFSVPLRGNERILDLAAAPGGKTTHLAALMHGQGLLVANEIKNKRVGHLAQNVERWGAGNVVITNESPERLADRLGAYFDRVLVDAPCSGEGMFRKDMGAREDWSVEMVEGCAARQGNILHVAGKLVRPGGYLLYSTCTFAPEEDEGVIAQFMEKFPDFEVMTLPQFSGFMTGKPEWLGEKTTANAQTLHGAVRLFPHRLTGEGHFACLLKRIAGPDKRIDERVPATEKRPGKRMAEANEGPVSPNRQQFGFWREFAGATLNLDLPEDRLRVVSERLYFVPQEMPDLHGLHVVHPGVWLGTFKKDRFEPAHPLALLLRRGEAKLTLGLTSTGREVSAYLRGETLESGGAPGWLVVTVDGFPLGWGKRVQGVVKNHYPRGWMVS